MPRREGEREGGSDVQERDSHAHTQALFHARSVSVPVKGSLWMHSGRAWEGREAIPVQLLFTHAAPPREPNLTP